MKRVIRCSYPSQVVVVAVVVASVAVVSTDESRPLEPVGEAGGELEEQIADLSSDECSAETA